MERGRDGYRPAAGYVQVQDVGKAPQKRERTAQPVFVPDSDRIAEGAVGRVEECGCVVQRIAVRAVAAADGIRPAHGVPAVDAQHAAVPGRHLDRVGKLRRMAVALDLDEQMLGLSGDAIAAVALLFQIVTNAYRVSAHARIDVVVAADGDIERV